jgi:hypothetical protein
MPVKSFTDTSAVSLAYAIDDGTTPAEFIMEVGGYTLDYIPFTTEGFNMAKEAKTSTAITNDRRQSNSKNTKGSASGAVTMEFGATPFILDMLSLGLMNEWAPVDELDFTKGAFITDGDIKKFMVVEKTVKSGPDTTDMLFHERYYGTMVNDFTMEFGDGELITLALNTISMFADYASAAAGADGLGGSIATEKRVPADYEIADSSNNLKNLILKDPAGVPLEVVFSDASLQVQNNVREQPGLGHEFAAGVGMGKVAVSLSGEIYFFDQTVLDAHMKNKRLSGEMTVDTAEGTFYIILPNLVAQSPSNSAEGENQDYKTSITLTAEKGSVMIEGVEHVCSIVVKYVAKRM